MTLFLLGVGCGIGIVLFAGIVLMPQMGRLFFVEDRSLLPFDEAVKRIKKQCPQHKPWHIVEEKDYNIAYAKKGKEQLPFRLTEFKLGNPDHSYLVNKQFPAVCTLMPAAIAVVEYKDNEVRIYRKNTGLMAHMFTGDIKKIMQHEVPKELDMILDGVIRKE